MAHLLQLKISLKGSRPPIWRRVLVSSEMSLLDLHDVIQFVFGWQDYHLFIFELGSFEFVNYPDWEEDAYQFQSAEDAILGDLIPTYLPQGGKFVYRYDMGDGWEHEIIVEESQLESELEKLSPICISGKRACPPEDVGGIGGYAHFLEVLNDPSHEEYEAYLTWIGGSFDPEEFDLGYVNSQLKTYLKERGLARKSHWREEDRYSYPVSFSSPWTENIDHSGHEVAESLALRRDMVTLLEYLKDNRVKGTAAKGNFPLKHIRAMTGQFVNPPELDQKIGERIYKLRTEDEVPYLMFLHVLANAAGFIYGGEGLPWEVTALGNEFLQRDPLAQTWYLTAYWLTRMNWYCLYPYVEDGFIGFEEFIPLAYEIVLNLPVSEKVPIESLVNMFDEKDPDWVTRRDGKDDYYRKLYFLWHVLLTPFDHLGILRLVEDEDKDRRFAVETQFIFPEYGQTLIRYFNAKEYY